MELVGGRQDVAFAMEKYRLSERHACELNGLDRSTYRYEPEPDRNAELRANLTERARQRPRFGYRRLGVLLERDGEVVNHKRLLRVYQQAGLAVRVVVCFPRRSVSCLQEDTQSAACFQM